MIRRKVSGYSFALAALLLAGAAVANAQCSGTTTIACTGGTGAHVQYDDGLFVATPADHYPTTITVPSTFTGTVTGVTIKLNNYVALFSNSTPNGNSETSSTRMGLLLVHGSNNLEIMNSIGAPLSTGQNIPVLTIQDGNALMPSGLQGCVNWNQTTSIAYAPTSNFDSVTDGSNTYPSPAPAIQYIAEGHGRSDCTTLVHTATPNTLAGVFTGTVASGDWSLYLVDDWAAADVKFDSWELDITVSASATGTTTTLQANPTTVYTSAPNNSVVLTATVNGSVPTGNVTFKRGSTTPTCAEGNPSPLSSGTATCTTTSFTTEGLQSLTAFYNGDANNLASQGSTGIFLQNHATNPTGTTYCNSGAISGTYTNIVPYPSVIDVGDGTSGSPPISGGSVDTVSLQLTNFSTSATNGLAMLLVSPDGQHGFEFWGEGTGAGPLTSSGNFIFQDGSPQLPTNPISPGTYGPTVDNDAGTFPAPPAPAPQPPSSFVRAALVGSSTFQSSMLGATANGAWTLYLLNYGGLSDTTDAAGGWCIDISPATGHATTTGVTSNPHPNATKGAPVTFTATVTSSPAVGNTGQVTFTENASPLTGAPNSGVASVSNGVATISTSTLPEGDHTITATYHDSTNSYNDSLGTVSIRVDAATPTPTLSGSTWSYCNPSGITIPAGTLFINDIGPAAPNPSNIFVANLPGTINSAGVTLKQLHITSPGDLESLLVGPNGASAPVTAQTLDFFSHAGGSGGSTAFGPQDTSFLDGFAPVSAASAPGTQNGPTSYGTTSYTASPFYTLPGIYQYATSQGQFTFNTGALTGTGGGVYTNTDPNGTWSVYFDQLIHHSGDGASAWCMNFTENPVTAGVTESHTGSAPGNDFVQGEQGAQLTTAITNNGTGPTGDPDGNHPLTVTDTLNPAFTYVSAAGSGWSCSAILQVVTCVNHSAIAQGNSYPTLTLNVNVSNTATPGLVSNLAQVSGGGVASNSGSDSIAVEPAPVLGISETSVGTFTQGQTAEWDIQVSNTATGSTTSGTATVANTLPTNYTIANFGTTLFWSCSGIGTGTASCTTTQAVTGGSSFSVIQIIVNVPAASPVSVTNNAVAYGGGDLTHTNPGNGVTAFSTVSVVQVPASVTATGGTPQSATIGTAFALALSAVVKDAGGVVVPSYPVVFSAPSTGPSGAFSNSTTTITAPTGPSGTVSQAFTANNTAGGPYNVTATAGSVYATFSLTNLLPQFVLTTAANPTIGGTVTPTSGGSYNSGAVVPLTASPTSGYAFVNWTSAPDSVDNPTSASTTITMNAPESVTANFAAFATAVATTTAVQSSQNPSFTISPNNSVTFTATVTYNSGTPVGANGSITFTDAGNPVAGGPTGPVPLDVNGTASFTTTSLSEATHTITATYSGYGSVAASYLGSSGTVSQEVDDHTVVTGNQFCNTGPLATSSTAGPATPFPSRIFVSGYSTNTNIGKLTLTLNNISSTSNIPGTDLLLVGPTGAAIVPFAGVGDNSTIPGVNITLDDAASGLIPGGSPLTNGTYQPTSITGSTSLIFPAPAPVITAANYAATDGAATLASTFNNTAPNGTWELFAMANSANGAASIGGGWCVTVTPTVPTKITTSPAGLLVSVDGGTAAAAPLVENWAVGSSHTIATTSPQAGTTGLQYVWNNWSDSGAISHSISVPSTATTYIASFTTQYQLTTQASPSADGSVTVPTSGGYYAAGAGVPVTATPNAGFLFSNWTSTGGTFDSATTASTNFHMPSAPATVTGNFAPATAQITVTTSPANLLVSVDGGTLTAAPLVETWNIGSSHTIATTSPQAGATGVRYVWNSWSDSGAISHSITVPSTATTYTANFTTQYQLTTQASPSADGSVTAPTSGGYYASGAVIPVVAAPASVGYLFNDWTSTGGTFVSATSPSTNFHMPSAATTVTANFVVNNVAVTLNTSPQGLLVSVNGGTSQAAPLTVPLQVGSQQTIATSTPQGSNGTQYTFLSWSDHGALSHTITVPATATAYTASFSTSYLLTTGVSPSGGGTVAPATGYQAANSKVPLTATPAAGYVFSSWTGPVASTSSASTTVTMSAPESVTANFISALTVSPYPSYSFGTVYLGTLTTKNFTVSNTGTTPITMTGPFISIVQGGNSEEFVEVDECPKSLPGGSHCTISVTFVAGPFYSPQTAILSIMDNAPGNPQKVTLTATVIDPQANFTPSSLSFSTQSVGTPTTKTVTLKNTGATTLSNIAMTVTGTNASDFKLTPSSTCGSSLPSGNSCTISVTFRPAAKGSRSATLQVTDNTHSGVQTVPLSGTGH